MLPSFSENTDPYVRMRGFDKPLFETNYDGCWEETRMTLSSQKGWGYILKRSSGCPFHRASLSTTSAPLSPHTAQSLTGESPRRPVTVPLRLGYSSFSGFIHHRKKKPGMPSSKNVQGKIIIISKTSRQCCSFHRVSALLAKSLDLDNRASAGRLAFNPLPLPTLTGLLIKTTFCFLGGKAFGLLKEQQRHKLEEINQVRMSSFSVPNGTSGIWT